MAMRTISAEELPRIIEEGKTLIDVRTPAEFRAEHVAGAEPHPLDQLHAEDFCKEHDPDKPVYILCQS